MTLRHLVLILLLAAGCRSHDLVIVNRSGGPVVLDLTSSDGSFSEHYELKKGASVTARFAPKTDAHLVFAINDGQKVSNLAVGYFEPRSSGMECYALGPNGGLSRCGDERVFRCRRT
jgi:hypothetical protein